MRIMTRKEEQILDKLMVLANGNVLLVEQAFREARRKAKPDLKDVVNFIVNAKGKIKAAPIQPLPTSMTAAVTRRTETA
jgi:hypothetical protein